MTDHADESVPPGESREEIVSRVNAEQEEIYEATGSSLDKDITSKRRLGTRGILIGSIGALVGAGAGLLIGIVAWNLWIPISLAVVGFVLSALLVAERDDGAIASKAEAGLRSNPATDHRSHQRSDR